jgi:hypothetical protein
MFSFKGGVHYVGTSLYIIPFVLLSLILDIAQYTGWGERYVARVPLWQRAIIFGMLFAAVLIAGADNSQVFFYYQF